MASKSVDVTAISERNELRHRLLELRRENTAMQSRCLDVLEAEWARVRSVAGPLPVWTEGLRDA